MTKHKKLIFTPELCTGCRACEVACSFHTEGIFSPHKSRIRVVRLDENGIDIPTGCEHCDNALCMLICPVRALSRDANTGAVVLNPDVCIGCKQCLSICPFGAIHYDPKRRLLYKCDLCMGEPECVKWCYTGALRYEEPHKISRYRQQTAVERIVKALSETRKHYV